MSNAIVTRNLTKRYGNFEALRTLSLEVPTGSMFGFLGPNGAGKTTAIRILLGLLRATEGEASVLGQDAWFDGPLLRRQVGYLPGDVRFYEHLTGRETLEFADAVRGSRARAEMQRLADVFALDVGKRVRDYSRGMKQKLGLIQAMMHRPRLLILDEPTTALDPLMQQTLYDELLRFTRDGATVLFSSHTLSEVEQLCDCVAILRAGRLIECSRIEALRRRAVRQLDVIFRTEDRAALPPLPEGAGIIDWRGAHLRGTWTGPVAPLLSWLAVCPVEDIVIAEPNLEDLFFAYYNSVHESSGAK